MSWRIPVRPATAALASLTLAAAASLGGVASAHPDHDGQHGSSTGHLPPSSRNVDLVGKLELTGVNGGIADVAAFGDYAYLAAFSPECAGRPGAQGTGVHVVDISDPASPVKVGFLPAHPNSYVGEGVHVMHVETAHFTGDILVHNNETCDSTKFAPSGVSIWDVTDPRNPVFLAQGGDTTPAVALQTFHTTHSVQGFTQGDRAYVVLQDNQEARDVDILDITDPRNPVLVSERGLSDWPAAFAGGFGYGTSVFHHDMQYQVIDGHSYLAVSYWDAGQVLLNIDDPANPVYVTDSNFSSPDPEMPSYTKPEGNSHNSYWSSDGKYLLSTDEDFSPTRTLFEITSGGAAGQYDANQFSWTVPIAASGLSGRTVWGGSGCVEDTDGNGVSDRAEIPPAASSGGDVLVMTRGTCFFSVKVESAQLAGYQKVVVGNSHGASQGGLFPDAFLCGSQGHAFTVTASGVCVGHRTMHLLFADAPGYTGSEGADMPAIGTVGETIAATTSFDGWGYVHLHDGRTLAELDTFAVPEAMDPAYATGFGNLTVHEVKTDPRQGVNLAYLSYYDAGLRVVKFGADGMSEVGHYIAEGGNDFWGVVPHCVGQCQLAEKDKGRGNHNAKRPLLLMSDRDSGLWILRYTGSER